MRIAVVIAPTNLNPILAQNSIENFIDGLVFDELVTLDNHGNEIPDLAAVVPTRANGGISADGRTITYHLRTNARWQDGVPITGKDVAFTWRAIMNPANNVVSRHGYDRITSVGTPNASTVVFHFKTRFAPAVDTIFGESDSPYRILPAHLLASKPNLNAIRFNSLPVGSGPYRVVRWVRGDHIELRANAQYFRGKPRIGRILIRIIPNENTVAALMRTGEIDLAQQVDADVYHDLSGVHHVARVLANAPIFTAIIFNMTRPPLNSLRVRRAIVLALDRARIASDSTYGTAIEARADLSPFSWAYDRKLAPLPYDPARARKLLQSVGKIRPFQLIYGSGSPLSANIVVQVQAALERVGLSVTAKSYDLSTLYGAAPTGGILNGGRFDLALYSWVSGADPDNSSQWLCSATPPRGNNVTHYCSAAMDAAQHAALTHTSRILRRQAYARIESLLLRDVPAAFLYNGRLRYLVSPSLRDFRPNGISEGWNAYRWHWGPARPSPASRSTGAPR